MFMQSEKRYNKKLKSSEFSIKKSFVTIIPDIEDLPPNSLKHSENILI